MLVENRNFHQKIQIWVKNREFFYGRFKTRVLEVLRRPKNTTHQKIEIWV